MSTPPARTALSPPRILWLVVLLWLAGIGAAAQFAKIGVPFAALQALYPGAGAGAGLLLSSVSLVGMLLGLVAGVLVARVGLRSSVLAALFAGALLSLWQATLPGFAALLASRIVEGATHVALVVAAPTLIAQITPDDWRGRAMTLWSTFFGVAFAGMALGGQPFVARYGLGSLFVVHGVFLASVGLLLLVSLPVRALRRPEVQNVPAPSLAPGALLRAHIETYRSPRLAAAGFGWLFYAAGFVASMTILPDLVTPERRAFVATLMPLVSIAASLALVPLLLRQMSAVRVVILGFALAGVFYPLLAVETVRAEAILLVFAALGLVQGASFAAVPELNPSLDERAKGNAAMAQLGNLGNLVGTPAVLALLAWGGVPAMIGAALATYVLGIAAHIWCAARRGAEDSGA